MFEQLPSVLFALIVITKGLRIYYIFKFFTSFSHFLWSFFINDQASRHGLHNIIEVVQCNEGSTNMAGLPFIVFQYIYDPCYRISDMMMINEFNQPADTPSPLSQLPTLSGWCLFLTSDCWIVVGEIRLTEILCFMWNVSYRWFIKNQNQKYFSSGTNQVPHTGCWIMTDRYKNVGGKAMYVRMHVCKSILKSVTSLSWPLDGRIFVIEIPGPDFGKRYQNSGALF